MPPMKSTDRDNFIFLLLASAFAISAAAASLVVLEKLKNAVIALAMAKLPLNLSTILSELNPFDLLLVAIPTVVALVLIIAEIRQKTLSRFMATATDSQVFLLLTIVVALLGHAYFFPGVLLGGDTGTHIARTLEVRRGLETGALPGWTNYQYIGSPLLGFTGPLLFVISGAVDYLVKDAILSIKLILFVSHMIAGWLFFAWLRQVGIDRIGALVGAIAFAGAFAHLHLFLYRGVIPQALTIIFFLLVFICGDAVMRGSRMFSAAGVIFSFATAGLLFNHQPHALFVAIYFGTYALASILVGTFPPGGVLRLVPLGIAGGLIATGAVLPIVVEANWVMIDPEGGFLRFQIPTVQRLVNLVWWRNERTTWGIDYWAYLGIITIGLAGYGAVTSLKGQVGQSARKAAFAFAPGMMLSLFMYNPVVRDVMFLLFFVANYAALGALRLQRCQGGWGISAVFACLLIDLGSTSLQPVGRSDKQFMIEAGRYLEQSAPNERIVEINITSEGKFEANMGPNAGPVSYASLVQRVAGTHNMAATHVHNYIAGTVKLVEKDLQRDRRVSPEAVSLLRMLNVSRIVCFRPMKMGCPADWADIQDDGPLGRIVRIDSPTPVVFARRLDRLVPPNRTDKPMMWDGDFDAAIEKPQAGNVLRMLHSVVSTEQLRPGHNVAVAIPVRGLPLTESEQTNWTPRLLDYSVSLERVRLKLESDAAGFVQLAHPAYPGNAYLVNGTPVRPIEAAFGLAVLPIDAGVTTIEIDPTTTSVRRISSLVSAVSACALLSSAIIGWFARRGRQRSAFNVRDETRIA